MPRDPHRNVLNCFGQLQAVSNRGETVKPLIINDEIARCFAVSRFWGTLPAKF